MKSPNFARALRAARALVVVTISMVILEGAGSASLSALSLFHVANNAALEQTPATAYSLIVRDGYAARGDAPQVTYVSSASACTLNSGAGDGGIQVPSSDGGCWNAIVGATWDVRDSGAVSGSTADQTANFQKALNVFGVKGGIVYAPGRFRLNSTITVPVNATLDCGLGNIGPGANVTVPYGAMNALLSNVGSGEAINTAGPGTFRNCLVVPYGMSFPQSSSSAWQGTAITFRSGSSSAGDFKVENVMALGWNQCLYSSNNDRGNIRDFYCDANNGEYIAASLDSWTLFRVHNWPYATVAYSAGSPPASALIRTGIGVEIYDENDNLSAYDVLSLGYLTDFLIEGTPGNSCCNVFLDHIWADAATGDTRTNTIGVDIEGAFDHIEIGNLTTTTLYTNVKVNASNPASHVHIASLDDAYAVQDGIDLVEGALSISYVDIAQPGQWAINVSANNNSTLSIGQGILRDGSSASEVCPIGIPANMPLNNLLIDPATVTTDGSWPGPTSTCLFGGHQWVYPTVPSATTIYLPQNVSAFNVSGTTNISNMQAPASTNSVETMIFTGVTTVENGAGGGGEFLLNGATNFTTQAGSSLTVIYDPAANSNAGAWRETSRTSP